MIQLPNSYRKNSYNFHLIERTKDVCVFSQSDESGIIAYEVFEVQKLPERIINGVKIEAREATPSNEQWGVKGFTYWKLENARLKANALLAHQKNKLETA